MALLPYLLGRTYTPPCMPLDPTFIYPVCLMYCYDHDFCIVPHLPVPVPISQRQHLLYTACHLCCVYFIIILILWFFILALWFITFPYFYIFMHSACWFFPTFPPLTLIPTIPVPLPFLLPSFPDPRLLPLLQHTLVALCPISYYSLLPVLPTKTCFFYTSNLGQHYLCLPNSQTLPAPLHPLLQCHYLIYNTILLLVPYPPSVPTHPTPRPTLVCLYLGPNPIQFFCVCVCVHPQFRRPFYSSAL